MTQENKTSIDLLFYESNSAGNRKDPHLTAISFDVYIVPDDVHILSAVSNGEKCNILPQKPASRCFLGQKLYRK